VGGITYILPMGDKTSSGFVIDGDNSTCITLSSMDTWVINLERNETVTSLTVNPGTGLVNIL
jgi:hypothetical protein